MENQVQKRSKSWEKTIERTREDIKNLQDTTPSLNEKHIESIFDKTLEKAKKLAEKEMQEKVKDDKLTWDEVFKIPYLLTLLFIIFLITLFL